MSIGNSGRIVIEIDPSFKKELYSALYLDGTNLKEWFVSQAVAFLENQKQPALQLDNISINKN